MKKLITTILITIFLINTSFSQIFDGIKISGDFNTTLEKFKSKGYIVEDMSMEGAILSLKNTDVFLLKTLITNKVFRAVVFLPEKNNWADLKSEFNKYNISFTKKYGQSSCRSNFFNPPYKEGNGKEMKALASGDCKYWSNWESLNGASYRVEISKHNKIKLTYENDANAILKDEEVLYEN